MNKLVLTGRLGRDAELKYLETGKNVTKFTLAVDKNYKREGDVPTWFNCELWGREKLSNYLTKGKAVLVIGDCTEGNDPNIKIWLAESYSGANG